MNTDLYELLKSVRDGTEMVRGGLDDAKICEITADYIKNLYDSASELSKTGGSDIKKAFDVMLRIIEPKDRVCKHIIKKKIGAL